MQEPTCALEALCTCAVVDGPRCKENHSCECHIFFSEDRREVRERGEAS